MYKKNKQKNKIIFQKGFTLVETLVAIAILVVTIGALLTLTTGGFYAVRYSRNDIVANNLLQESLEYIHNTRDNYVSQGQGDWGSWLSTFDVDDNGNQVYSGDTRGCFYDKGCVVDAYAESTNIRECSNGTCYGTVFFPDQQFYGYKGLTYPHILAGSIPYDTSFVRTIHMKISNKDPNQVVVTADITWLNGTNNKSLSQSIVLNNWQL